MGRVRMYASDQDRRQAQNVRRKLARESIPLDVRKPLTFIGVDGEGVGRWRDHKYVLLGIGSKQIEDSGGLQLNDIFSFLWDQFLLDRHAVYAGFYLGYDFTQWLKQLPKDRAWYLFSQQGIAKRRRLRSGSNPTPFPVHWKEWEFDILGMKRFKLRPYGEKTWMYICDSGPFFQTSLLKAIDPKKWQEPICSEEEYAILVRGKGKRDSARLDQEMRDYNALENSILSHLLVSLSQGFAGMGVRLKRDQWFGPGQAAQEWLSTQNDVPTAEQLTGLSLNSMRVPNTTEQTVQFMNSGQEYSSQKSETSVVKQLISIKMILNLGRLTYYGGWFEIFCHGHIPDKSWGYDVNSAYAYIASRLPCLLHGKWTYRNRPNHRQIQGNPYTITHAIVRGTDHHIGAMLHRHPDGRIVRPHNTAGYYWLHELEAAQRAGFIDELVIKEAWTYEPCNCRFPLANLVVLYDLRLSIGKNTPRGKAAKTVYASVYGKFAQSVGNPRFGNSIYASLITAGTRTMILDAIATHPDKSNACLMVATDGIYFRTPHPDLPISQKLGEWDVTEHTNLTLFKPGIYWDDNTRYQIRRSESPVFKSRGINANEFAKSIQGIDNQFRQWGESYPAESDPNGDRAGWFPKIVFRSGFAMVTCQQALQRGKWFLAGAVSEQELTQDSDPVAKRHSGWYQDGIYWSRPHEGWWEIESTPYDETFGQGDIIDPDEYGIHPDGWVVDLWREGMSNDN